MNAQFTADCFRWAVIGGLVFALAADSHAGLDMIANQGGTAGRVFIHGNHAYFEEGTKLVVLDIANPANPPEWQRCRFSMTSQSTKKVT